MSEPSFEGAEVVQIADGGPVGVRDFLGTDYMIGEAPTLTFQDRIQRCYELAGYAVVFGKAPAYARLVHGSWQGPNATQRIGHAWVELKGGLIWEPIFAAVFLGDRLRSYARMWDERTYDSNTARRMINANGHWGRWHDSRYP